jgi:hypothetical protein
MAGSSNFLVFNPSLNNALSDTDYSSNSTRTNGLGGGIARSDLHNKIYYQTTILAAALAESFSDLGYTVSDSSFTNLKSVFATILNTSGGEMTGDLILNSDPTQDLQAATKQYVDSNLTTAKLYTDTEISAISIPSIAILTGTISDGSTIPLPSGYTQSQCTWFITPRYIVDDVSSGDIHSFNYYADSSRVAHLLVEGIASTTSTATYVIIGIK